MSTINEMFATPVVLIISSHQRVFIHVSVYYLLFQMNGERR